MRCPWHLGSQQTSRMLLLEQLGCGRKAIEQSTGCTFSAFSPSDVTLSDVRALPLRNTDDVTRVAPAPSPHDIPRLVFGYVKTRSGLPGGGFSKRRRDLVITERPSGSRGTSRVLCAATKTSRARSRLLSSWMRETGFARGASAVRGGCGQDFSNFTV